MNMRSLYKTFLLGCAIAGSALAQTADPGAMVAVSSMPKATPTKALTSFAPALRCMDQLFLAFGKRGIVVTSLGIPDQTGKIRAGTKEMMITALSRMSLKSGAFDFIDFHSNGDDLDRLFAVREGQMARLPDFYIRGAITQLDESVLRISSSSELARGGDSSGSFLDPISFAFGSTGSTISDMMSMDISIGHAATRRILPMTATSNSMVLRKTDKGVEGGNTFGRFGFSFSLDRSQTEGTGAATRALLELSLIETLGRFTQVPYWRCLGDDLSNPQMREQARLNFDTLGEVDRIRFVQQQLSSTRAYAGPVDGIMTPDLAAAIAEYQARNSLPTSGRIDFDLYAALLEESGATLASLTPPAK